MLYRSALLAMLLEAVISVACLAQSPITAVTNTTSTPIPNVAHDYLGNLSEIVNPANGAVSVRIKSPNPENRGVNWNQYVVMYDTNGLFNLTPTWFDSDNVYQMNTLTYGVPCVGCSPNQVAYSSPGLTYNVQNLSAAVGGPGNTVTYTCTTHNGYIFTDPEGGRHELGIQVAQAGAGGTYNCSYFSGATTVPAGGDEQYKATVDPSTLAVSIVDEHGDSPPQEATTQQEDSNGNQFNNSGRLYTSPTTSGTTTNYTVTFHNPGTSGNYVETWSSQTLSFNLNYTVLANSFCYAGTIGPPPNSSGWTIAQLTSLKLPNGQQYTFSYDPTYGTLTQITYPTGAWTKYTWKINSGSEGHIYGDASQQGGSGGSCAIRYDWPAIATRQVSYDGTNVAEEQDFTYATNWPNQTSAGWTTKMTTVKTIDSVSGKSFQTVYNYTPTSPQTPNPSVNSGQAFVPQESTILYYNDLGQTLLRTTTKRWLSWIQLGAECETLPGAGTLGRFYKYQPYPWVNNTPPGNAAALLTDLKTDVAEYDYGTVDSACDRPTTLPLRDTQTAYWPEPAPYSPLLLNNPATVDRPASVVISSASGSTEVSQEETDYGYDETAVSQVIPAAIGHDQRYAAGSGNNYARGNLTTVKKKCFPSCADVVTKYTYDETGQVTSMIPAAGTATTYSYVDQYTSDDGTPSGNTNIFPTTITRGPFSKSYTYGFNGGKLRSVTDENQQKTSFWYLTGGASGAAIDPWYRLTEIDPPDAGKTSVTYNDAGPKPSTVVAELMSTTGSTTTALTTTTVLDAAGHPTQTQRSDPVNTVFVDTKYDGLGRAYSVSNPYRSTSDTTYGLTTKSFDAIGRVTNETEADSAAQTWIYNGNATTFTDESGRQWKRTTDALGRLTSVLEPSSTSMVPSVQTAYTYDVLGNLRSAVQAGVTGETSRTRTFSYNSLSQLVTSTNPETGTICYGTWVSGVCQGGYDLDGNLAAKTDARTTTVTYGYDTLDRLTSKTYSDSTPAVQFSYDQSTVWSENLNNTKNRVSSYTSGTGQAAYTRLYSYDPVGRISALIDAPPSEAGRTDQHTTFTYDKAGNTTDIWYPRESPAVGPHIQQTWLDDGLVHKVYSTDSGTEKDFLEAATYYADGSPSSLSLGNGVVENLGRNNRLQTQSLVAANLFSTVTNPLASGVSGYALMSNAYAYTPSSGLSGCGGSGNNGNIWQISDALNSASWTRKFSYDCLNRLSGENYGSASTSFRLDSFGNMSPLNGSTPVYTFSSSTNRISNLPCGASLNAFDAAGNQTCDTDANGANRAYAVDAEELPVSLSVQGSNTPFVQYVYSGEGDRIRKSLADGEYFEYTWRDGQVLTEKQTSSLQWTDYIYANGKKLARVDTSKYLLHLHGVRTSANSSCGVEGPASGTGVPTSPQLQIASGDHLAFDFMQTVASYGGMLLVFTDGTNSGAVQDMQTGTGLYNDGANVGAWQHLEGDLTPYAGKTLDHATLGLHQSMPSGAFDMYYANAVIIHANGSITSINTVENVTVPAFSGTTCGAQSMTSATEQTQITDPAITTTYYLSDHLGTTDLELSGGGWPVWHGHYTSYGQEIANAGTWNRYKFTGKERDTESGLDYFGARYYSSLSGRFSSPDWAAKPEAVPYSTIGQPQSLNLYSYVQNNPLSRADNDGHCPVCAYAAEIVEGAAAGAAIGVSVEVAASLTSHQDVTRANLEAAAVQGAITGAVAAATAGVSLVSQSVAQAGANLIGGVIGREVTGSKTTKADAAIDVVAGALSPVVAKVAGPALSKAVGNQTSAEAASRGGSKLGPRHAASVAKQVATAQAAEKTGAAAANAVVAIASQTAEKKEDERY